MTAAPAQNPEVSRTAGRARSLHRPAFMPDDFFEHERLDVYRTAREFFPLAMAIVPRQGERSLLDQLERAGQSILLNIAEGAGRHSRADKQRFYEIAKGSAMECASIIDILQIKGLGSPENHAKVRALNIRVVQMLSRMCGARGRTRLGERKRARQPGDGDGDV